MRQFFFLLLVLIGRGIVTLKHLLDNNPSMPRLIPRALLFDNPTKIIPKLSPDGTMLSYVAPYNDVLNIWIRKLGSSDPDYVVTQEKKTGLRKYFWTPDSKQILYLQDTDGDENWRLYGIDLQSKTVRCFTPFDNVMVSGIFMDKKFPDTFYLSINKEDRTLFDLYQLTLSSGTLEMAVKNTGNIGGFIMDHTFKPRAALSMLSSGERQILFLTDGKWVPVLTWPVEDAGLSLPLEFAEDNISLYLKDTENSNTARLVKFNPITKTKEILAQDPDYDLTGAWFDEDTHHPVAATFQRVKHDYVILEKTFLPDFKIMSNLDKGEIEIVDCDDKKNHYLVRFIRDTGPSVYYLYDTKTKSGTYLFSTRPELERYTFSPMKPITFQSRDGLNIHGYLTIPAGTNGKALPLVLYVHGGPHSRDVWGFDPVVQWLANRGYAVLQVNYRGSSGYGKKFEHAGDREWGNKMHDDLIDAISWAADQGIVDRKKIAIFGGSYGGYAALVGATFTPDTFNCAIASCGPSNLMTFMDSFPSYWEVYKSRLYKKIGNRDEEEFLKSRSPLFKVDALKIPLLIVHGARDPRVKQAESEQFVEMLKSRGIKYEYLLFPDEGHGLVKPENRLKFYAVAENFLSQCLGGQCE